MSQKIWDIKRGYSVYRSVSTEVLQRWIEQKKVNEGEIFVWTSGMSGSRRPEELDEFKPFFKKREKKKKKVVIIKPRRRRGKPKRHPKVVIIDDEKSICTLLEKYLKRRRFIVNTATTGRGGFNIVKTQKPDIVLLDLRLKDTDGLKILRKIRKLRPKKKVVIISAFGDPETKEKAFRLGASRFLDKPFKRRDLFKAIKEA